MKRTYIVTYIDQLSDDGHGKVKTATREVKAENDREAAQMVYASLPSGRRPSDILPVMEVDENGRKTGKVLAAAALKPRQQRVTVCDCGNAIERERVRPGRECCAACATGSALGEPAEPERDVEPFGLPSIDTSGPRGLIRRRVRGYTYDARCEPVYATPGWLDVEHPEPEPIPDDQLPVRLRKVGVPAGAEPDQPFDRPVRDRGAEYLAAGSAGAWSPDTRDGRPSKY